ncbi:MAG: O-antigen ligase family protein [Bacteroidia bacterium]
MRKSLLPPVWHHYIYIFALVILVVGLPLSQFLMSLSQIILAANYLLEGNLVGKWRSFFKNKTALVLCSLFLMHFIGLIWTSDFDFAWNDIRVKMPLLVLPVILSTAQPISKKNFEIILYFFVAAISVGTVISMFALAGYINGEAGTRVVDVREASIFISHIRFALLIDIAIFVCGYFIYHSKNNFFRLCGIILIMWLVIFLVIIESMTGLVALGLASVIVVLFAALRSSKKVLKIAGIAFVFGVIGFGGFVVSCLMQPPLPTEKIDFSKTDWLTPRGKVYYTDSTARMAENGHLIWTYVCDEELESAWNKRSGIKFSGTDLKGNPLRYTLIRFLASKGLRKDQDGVNALSDDEVKAIERGAVNVDYQDISSIAGRLHEIKWELDLYHETGDPNGHSLTMRFEFWKAALKIIKAHPLIGVGTGDLAVAYKDQYRKMNSPLKEEWRLRSHNQYLAIGIGFGLAGLLWFLFTLFYPMIHEKKMFDYLYITFFIIAIVSFLTEDTLETQAGVTFFAFFNAFFLFRTRQTPTSQTPVVSKTPGVSAV